MEPPFELHSILISVRHVATWLHIQPTQRYAKPKTVLHPRCAAMAGCCHNTAASCRSFCSVTRADSATAGISPYVSICCMAPARCRIISHSTYHSIMLQFFDCGDFTMMLLLLRYAHRSYGLCCIAEVSLHSNLHSDICTQLYEVSLSDIRCPVCLS